ncbi:Protein-L-isoaspartate(D-aspartate) O-methyltransferase [Tritrichomonas foetus]|uniref:Protein-L-isoaspartate O-methyltransferase n=1 Tax=Tritrichomonas foetus TaxID=1144522 RepID=A0A1J4KPX7_9EUKA|nr:Protein-L-isoaspartate(D-aspartate) O-methyltransferase [Tritrichomonas foetus]|eukprot:OHT11844.1 Protein-L-isoaspartate(D-aspartate) O-methyltransferase [Tritrichomonas foetus]
MAWRCSGHNNEELINNLQRSRLVKEESAYKAMMEIDRIDFVLPEFQSYAYEDRPLPIGYEVTISAPHMHAMMLDQMAPYLGPGTTALDIGSGSGYIVACMAKMCDKAYGIEHIQPLVPRSVNAVKKFISEDKFEICYGDGRLGLPEHAPYDVIHVGAAAQPNVVDALMKQLKPNGLLIIPVECSRGNQVLYAYTFDKDGKPVQNHVCDVMFVPLTSEPSNIQ